MATARPLTLHSAVLPAVIQVDRTSSKPLYRQLYDGYREAIVEQRLKAGDRLPSTRSLAAELGISRIPVLNAFEQLLAEGYFESRVGSGTFVARSLPDAFFAARDRVEPMQRPGRPARRAVSRRAEAILKRRLPVWFTGRGAFAVGHPPADSFPLEIWSRLVARRSRDASLLRSPGPLGLPALREAVAEYLRAARAVRCEADQIMIVGGSQQALDLCARALLDPGSPVWVEEPGYFGAQRVLELAGARIVPIPVDAEGLEVEEGIARCRSARAVFVTPSHQFPLGVTMSASRRLRLLDFGRRSGAWIIEDDYDSEYRYENLPIASLQGLDRDSRVLYIGTFTKTLFISNRLGYLVLPRDLVDRFAEVRRAMDCFSPVLQQAVMADFLREGHFARYMRRMRVLCGERRDALVEAVGRELGPSYPILGDRAGTYLCVPLPAGLRDLEISERAASQKLWAAPLSDCYRGRARKQGLVLGYGSTARAQTVDGVRRLREILAGASSEEGSSGAKARPLESTGRIEPESRVSRTR
jgi:GntR family transcriptional regulator/MocR family aminotransferase